MKVLVSSAAVAATAAIALSLSDVQLQMSRNTADGWRVVSFALCGVSTGLLAYCVSQFWRMRIDRNDRFLRTLGGLAIVFFLMNLFVAVSVADNFKSPRLTWRTPYAIYMFSMSIYLLSKLYNLLSITAANAKSRDATVRMTLTDTQSGGKFDLNPHLTGDGNAPPHP